MCLISSSLWEAKLEVQVRLSSCSQTSSLPSRGTAWWKWARFFHSLSHLFTKDVSRMTVQLLEVHIGDSRPSLPQWYFHPPPPELVYSGCHNKIPQTSRHKQQIVISHRNGGWKVKVKVSPGQFLVRALFLACRCVPSCCPHVAFTLYTWREVSVLWSLFPRTLVLSDEDPTLWPHLT